MAIEPKLGTKKAINIIIPLIRKYWVIMNLHYTTHVSGSWRGLYNGMEGVYPTCLIPVSVLQNGDRIGLRQGLQYSLNSASCM